MKKKDPRLRLEEKMKCSGEKKVLKEPVRVSFLVQLMLLAYVAAIVALILSADHGTLPLWMARCARLSYGDTTGHFILFGTLSLVLTIGFQFKSICVFSKNVFLGSVITFLFVTLEEFSQILIFTRTFSLLDLFADYVGIFFAGQCVGRLLLNRMKQNDRPDSQRSSL